jgi:hypothetical protein
MSLVDVIVKRITQQNRSGRQGHRRGTKTIICSQRPINLIFSKYGPDNFRRSFRMNESSFWKLLDMLDPCLVKPKQKKRRAPNGDILSSARLAMALQYFSGGDPIDISAVFSVHNVAVYHSVWLVVQAINKTTTLDIKFLTLYDKQQKIADQFQGKSGIALNNCTACIDGILTWINKPTKPELEKLCIGGKKFFCGCKKIRIKHASNLRRPATILGCGDSTSRLHIRLSCICSFIFKS